MQSQSPPSVDLSQIPPDKRTYDFGPASRCRIIAHNSIVLRNSNHHILVVDGGYGTFHMQFNGDWVQVPDLNPFTVAFDLSADFSTRELQPLWSYRKAPDSPMKRTVVNFGGLWSSEDHNTVWLQGGHFYHGERYLNSSYHVPKSEIPQWEMWEMSLEGDGYNAGWVNITEYISGYSQANRTFAGAASSPAQCPKKMWLGGEFDSTTSPTTPDDTIRATNQMLIFDEDDKSITKQKFYSADTVDGYWQGSLVHLPIGKSNSSGYLMSLMSLSNPVGLSWIDPDGESGNQEEGTYVSLDSIPMYDIDQDVWFEQKTTWFKDELPASRTRFCAALFQDKDAGTWDLWIHGGQQVGDNQNEGVEEIYVLSMPSFMWTKVETTLPQTNLIRSHTCHAVGGQLLIFGGWPTGLDQTNATCDPEYIKVLDIGEESSNWSGMYKKASTYRTPNPIKNVVSGRKTPLDDFANKKLQEDFLASTGGGEKSKTPVIVGTVLGALFFVALVVFALFLWRRWRARRGRGEEEETQSITRASSTWPARGRLRGTGFRAAHRGVPAHVDGTSNGPAPAGETP